MCNGDAGTQVDPLWFARRIVLISEVLSCMYNLSLKFSCKRRHANLCILVQLAIEDYMTISRLVVYVIICGCAFCIVLCLMYDCGYLFLAFLETDWSTLETDLLISCMYVFLQMWLDIPSLIMPESPWISWWWWWWWWW